LKETKLTADRDMVWKKVNALWTKFRRELQEIKDSEISDLSPDDVYMPSLWHLEEMNFLRDHEILSEGGCTVDSDDENSSEKSVSTTDIILYLQYFRG
jgi:hypothetical protein